MRKCPQANRRNTVANLQLFIWVCACALRVHKIDSNCQNYKIKIFDFLFNRVEELKSREFSHQFGAFFSLCVAKMESERKLSGRPQEARHSVPIQRKDKPLESLECTCINARYVRRLLRHGPHHYLEVRRGRDEVGRGAAAADTVEVQPWVQPAISYAVAQQLAGCTPGGWCAKVRMEQAAVIRT